MTGPLGMTDDEREIESVWNGDLCIASTALEPISHLPGDFPMPGCGRIKIYAELGEGSYRPAVAVYRSSIDEKPHIRFILGGSCSVVYKP